MLGKAAALCDPKMGNKCVSMDELQLSFWTSQDGEKTFQTVKADRLTIRKMLETLNHVFLLTVKKPDIRPAVPHYLRNLIGYIKNPSYCIMKVESYLIKESLLTVVWLAWPFSPISRVLFPKLQIQMVASPLRRHSWKKNLESNWLIVKLWNFLFSR